MNRPRQDIAKQGSAGGHAEINQGRRAYERRAWADAYRSFAEADQAAGLDPDDLECLATSAYLIGREEEYLSAVERAHHAHLEAEQSHRAARCAFWLGLHLYSRGDRGPGTGWFARARRLVEGETEECVEQGYLLLPVVQQHIEAAEWDAAHAAAVSAAEIGDRLKEADLKAAARHLQGRVLIHRGAVEKGLALLDEAMVAVTTEKLSPLATGLIYCSMIDGCQQIYAFARAREWTAALAEWCSKQPDLVAFSGKCLVHRAEIMQMNGAWSDAMKEARRISERFSHRYDRQAAAAACYQQAEVHRLRGEFVPAEREYQRASRLGLEPQPGLSLLRLTQGQVTAAASAIERAVNTSTDRLERTRLLPAYVEIMLRVGDIEAAQRGAGELAKTAEIFNTEVLGAMAAHARGAVALAEGDARAALGSLREAFNVWQLVEAPYLAARVRVQIGQACRALGDIEGARLELEAARAVFEKLGAAPDIVRLERLEAEPTPPAHACALTRRELQVLRLIASGKTNKAIAAELFVSEKTVDRHVSNIFDKLDVPSRAAATAYGYRHQLI